MSPGRSIIPEDKPKCKKILGIILNYFFQRCNGLRRALGRAGQRKGDAQLRILSQAQPAEGEQLDFLHIGPAAGRAAQGAHVVRRVVQAGHNDLPQPDRHACRGGLVKEGQRPRQLAAAVLAEAGLVGELQVADDQVGVGQSLRGGFGTACAGGVQRGVKALGRNSAATTAG